METGYFLRRLENVMAARVEARRAQEAPRFQRVRAIAAGFVGALVCLVILKGAAIAQGDLVGAATEASDWLFGVDPVSQSIAHVFTQGIQRL